MKDDLFFSFLGGLIIGAIFSCIVVNEINNDFYRKKLIEYSCAFYDPTTGAFTYANKTNNYYFIKIRECVKSNNGK